MALVDPDGHAYPAVQRPLQSAVPSPVDAGLNHVPAGHAEHDPEPATLNRPAGQIDTVELVDPAGHAYPAVHRPLQVAVV